MDSVKTNSKANSKVKTNSKDISKESLKEEFQESLILKMGVAYKKSKETGDHSGVRELRIQASALGVSRTQVEVAEHIVKNDLIEEEIKSFKPYSVQHTKHLESPVAFVDGLLLDCFYNQVGGPTKIGKSLGLYEIIIDKLRKINKRKTRHLRKGLIISTENSDKFMLNHQIEAKEAHDFIDLIDTKIITKFEDEDRVSQKIDKIIARLDYQLMTYKYKAMVIDPMPKFMDWNKEAQVSRFLEGLESLALKYECCIVGVRNDGKDETYGQVHRTKGTSAIEDTVRLLLRALPVHPKSIIGKKYPNNKSFILTSQYGNSLMSKPKAFVFIIETTVKCGAEIPIAIKKDEIEGHLLSRLEFMTSLRSAKNDRQLIYYQIYKSPGVAREQLRDALPHLKDDSLKQSIKRLKDSNSIKEIEGCFFLESNNSK